MKKIICMILTAAAVFAIFSPVMAEENDMTFTTLMYNDRKSDIKSFDISFVWNDSWFDLPATEYNHTLATSLCALCGAAYVDTKPDNVLSTLSKMGFDESSAFSSYIIPTREDNDSVGYVIAKKDMGTTELIAIIIKGTSEDSEWYSNFNIGSGDTHEGFLLASEKLYSDLEAFIANTPDKPKKFIITGHSRGAGVANIVAKMLNDSSYAEKESIFAYTFASPLVSIDAKTEGYENIHNILSSADFVTRLPLPSWGYGRFGFDIFLPEKSFSGEDVYGKMTNYVTEKYTSSTSKNYIPFEGTYSTDTLCREMFRRTDDREDFYIRLMHNTKDKTATFEEYFTLLCDILSGNVGISQSLRLLNDYSMEFSVINDYFMDNHISNDRLFSTHSSGAYFYKLCACEEYDLINNGEFFRLQVAGEVNISVSDKNGNVLAEVINGSINKNTLAVNLYSGKIYVDIPENGEYTVNIHTQKDVLTDISIEKLAVSKTEIPVFAEDYYDIELSTSDNIKILSGENFIVCKNDEPLSPVYSMKEDVPVYAVTMENVGNGMCYGGGKFRKGDKATVNAGIRVMEKFVGWYEGDELRSTSLSYTFIVEDDTHLYARFTENISIRGDLNKDKIVNADDLSLLLENYSTQDSACDIDNSGYVNSADLSILLGNFGKSI